MEPQSEPPQPVRARPQPPSTRPGAVVLAAVLTEIVLIAAVANQWVTPHLISSVINEKHAFLHNLKAAPLTFNWRLVPEHGDSQHTWLSQEMLILTTVVVSALLIATIVRGPNSFGRVFFTCWAAVMVATMFGTYVRGLVNDERGVEGSRIARALFGQLGPSPVTFFAGLLLGLVAGLVAATVAMLVRDRRAVAVPVAAPPAEAPYVPPEQPPPFNPIPRPGPGASAGAATAVFPRPPDDDDLGHDQHDN
jgi:hypothetical protein